MVTFELDISKKSTIYCGRGAFDKFLGNLGDDVFLITDTNVFKLYGDLIDKSFGKDVPKYVIPAGERSKNLKILTAILKSMVAAHVQRSWRVVALGGGVVGDIAGLAASLYMRGIKLTQIPTTLLAQVDSSVGGKTAIDFEGVKNLVGTFYQPDEVYVDPMFLNTLPRRQITCGLGEIVKYGALNADIFDKLRKNLRRIRNIDFLEDITADCIAHKAKVVTGDERDSGGDRKSLNMGHTTGHAFELYYKGRSHGEYVMIGMMYEMHIAEKKGICDPGYERELKKIVTKALGKVPRLENVRKAAEFSKFDKKNSGTGVSVILPVSNGVWTCETYSFEEYADMLEEYERSEEK